MNPSTAVSKDADLQAFAQLMHAESRQYGVVFIDRHGFISGWNGGAEFITGFSRQDVVGRPLAALFTAEDRALKLDQLELETAARTGSAEDERWHLRKDGSRFWAAGTCARLPVGAQGGDTASAFVKLFKDATHLRARASLLENTVQQSEKRIGDYGAALGKVTHELRNALAPMLNVLHLMKLATARQPAQDKQVEVMARQLGHMNRIVEDILDITRAGAGKLAIDLELLELQPLLNDVMANMLPDAQRQGVALQSILLRTPLVVQVDPVRLQQVLSNLIGNALKFTPAGGAVWLTATADDTHFLLGVRDTGQGIGRDLLPDIFNAFTQAPGADTGRGSGLGLGLAVVKEIVDLHRGTVEVRSEGQGKGSEFLVRMPLRAEPQAATLENDEPQVV